jgi:Ni/Co efflux regulator RcnB
MPVHPRETMGAPAQHSAMTPSRLRPLVHVLAVSVALSALAGPAAAWAQDPPRNQRDQREQRRDEVSRPQAPPAARPGHNRDALSDSVRRFERDHRGSRVLSVERMQSDGRDVNRIKAMDDRGRVRVYVDDPQRRPPPRRPPTRDDHD